MSFQLLVRLLAHTEGGEFHPASVYSFDDAPVSVGTSSKCDCCPTAHGQLGNDPVAFRIVSADEENDSFLLRRQGQEQIYVNDMAVDQENRLKSGDVIRINHLTFLFKVRPPQFHRWEKRRRDLFTAAAKIITCAVLFCEIAAVLWLPRKIDNYGLLNANVAQQRTLVLLDNLKQRVSRLSRPAQNYDSKSDEIRTYAFRLLKHEVDAIHTFVAQHESELSESQWQKLYTDLQSLSRICSDLRNSNLFRTLPGFKAREAFKSITDEQDYTLDQLYE